MTTDIPIERPSEYSRTGTTVPIRYADALPEEFQEASGSAISMFPVYNQRKGNLYVILRDVRSSHNMLYVLKEENALQNEWELVYDDEIGAGSSSHPFVTHAGTLIFSVSGSDGAHRLLRSTSIEWDDFEVVEEGFRFLHAKYAQDPDGAIFLGNYEFAGGEVIKSEDDGQTWETIADLGLDEDHHIHSITPAPHDDLVVAAVGDNDENGYFTFEKDGSNIQNENGLGPHGGNKRVGAIIPFHTSDSSGLELLCTSDDSGFGPSRVRVNHGSVDLRYCLDRFTRAGGRSYTTDAVYVDGGVAVLEDNGNILFTRDGWTWDSVRIEHPRHDWSTFSTGLTAGPRHVYTARDQLTIIPKDVFSDLDPQSAVYKPMNGTQESTTDDVTVMGGVPGRLFDSLHVGGEGDDNRLMIQHWADADRDVRIGAEELIDWPSGGDVQTETFDLSETNGYISIEVRDRIVSDTIFTCRFVK